MSLPLSKLDSFTANPSSAKNSTLRMEKPKNVIVERMFSNYKINMIDATCPI